MAQEANETTIQGISRELCLHSPLAIHLTSEVTDKRSRFSPQEQYLALHCNDSSELEPGVQDPQSHPDLQTGAKLPKDHRKVRKVLLSPRVMNLIPVLFLALKRGSH